MELVSNPDPVSFGAELRRMRRNLSSYDSDGVESGPLTQADLATDLSVHPSLISHWERGTKKPEHHWIVKLVKYFAGKSGCLETPEDAYAWVKLIREDLSEAEMGEAFKGVRPVQRAVAAKAATPKAFPDTQRIDYLYLLRKAYGLWEGKGIYVQPSADQLLTVAPDAPGRGPRRSYDHVFERAGFLRRERLEGGVLDWFLQHGHMALLAAPGCGKSTALEEMAGELARRELEAPSGNGLLPVLVSLGDYSAGKPLSDWFVLGARQALRRALVDWAVREWTPEQAEADADENIVRDFDPIAGHLRQWLAQGKLIVLLDGLNELPGGADGALRPEVERFVIECRTASPANLLAVACRVADYRHSIGGLNRIELLPFDEERTRQAVLGHVGERESAAEAELVWKQLKRQENDRLREVLAIPLYIEAFSKSLVRDAAGALCLPANRGQLLDGFVRALLWREHEVALRAGRPVLDPTSLHAILAEVAFNMRNELISRGSTRPLADVQRLMVRAISAQEGTAETCLTIAAGATLVSLNRSDGTLSFWKEPIEEVLAARYLLARFADGYCDECLDLWRVPLSKGDSRLADRRDFGEAPSYPLTEGAWEETTILAAGLAGTAEPGVSANAFVRAVLSVNPGLAGRCLLEGGAAVSEPIRAEVERNLLALMQDRSYSLRARAPCGVLLGNLGDPRFHGPELLCLPNDETLGFVEVPAGPFIMGSDRKTVAHWNRQAEAAGFSAGLYDDELTDAKPVSLPYAYLVARYPVTNAQFLCFVKDDGYCRKGDRWRHLWTQQGWDWLKGERWSDVLDRSWRNTFEFRRKRGEAGGYESYEDYRDRGVRPYLKRLRKDAEDKDYWVEDPDNWVPNQPVMGVTWYEAMAYSRWLQAKMAECAKHQTVPTLVRSYLDRGGFVGLPSEPEWEKAARGGLEIPGGHRPVGNPSPARQWPWQGDWDAGRCNVAEGEEQVKWLSPVGMYGDGASPFGCLDMVGNVWEWTRSAYRTYPYPMDRDGRYSRENPDEPGLPVLRGGSWDDPHRLARCAVRYGYDPDYIYHDIGFRVVVSLSDTGF